MFRKKIVVAAVIVAVVVGIFGWDTASGYITGAKESLKGFVSKHTSTEMDVSRIEALIKKEAGKISDFHAEIADLSDKIRGEQERVRKIEFAIIEQRDGLQKARGLIEQRKDVYFVGYRNRTLLEVEHDASARIKFVKSLEGQLVLSNTLIETLHKTESRCRGTLADANANLMGKQLELEQMKAREINAKIQAQANALSNSLVGMSDSILNHSELQDAMNIYAKKIARKERSSGQIEQGNSPWIDYSEPKELPNLIHRIDEVLADAK